MRFFLCAASCFSVFAAPAWADQVVDARQWHVDLKRAAKYARISIQSGDLNRLRTERDAVDALLVKSGSLQFPEGAAPVCRAAGEAVRDFISAAQAGNMASGPASFSVQFARWDRLGDQCLAAINGR
ncbi:hypothetical protein [Xanthobacter sp.]|uniref:hypothetical protein n=1 Tax=Xanthobacter sp. TaxID=35809 RepID=UPI0025F5F646|nr:hypothetical protein [Xanthobacter sp.]